MVVSAAAAVQGVREIADLVRKYNDFPLYEKIIHLQAQVLELTTERSTLKDENDGLKVRLGERTATVFRNPYYYAAGDDVPLCPRCYETTEHQLRVHLTHPPSEMSHGFGRICRNCKWFFLEGAPPPLLHRRASRPRKPRC